VSQKETLLSTGKTENFKKADFAQVQRSVGGEYQGGRLRFASNL